LKDPGLESRQGQEIVLFPNISTQALGPIQLSVQWAPGFMLVSVKLLGLEADRTPILVLRLRMSGATPLLPLCLHGVHTGSCLCRSVQTENTTCETHVYV
jgi:hypothetical protein